MRAALYARYSTELQSAESITDQFRVCQTIADRHDFKVVCQFSDAAISGGKTDRPGYQALLAAARTHDFDVIVAEDTSRLWRALPEQWRAVAELLDGNVHIVTHDIDTRSENFKILLSVHGAMADVYRDQIAYRTKRGLEGRARAHCSTGGKAYGYVAARDSKTGQIEVNDVEGSVVRRIFEMYADGMSPRAIAGILNEESIPSPGSTWKRTERRTAGWLSSAINADLKRGTGILANTRYVGVVKWGRSQWKRRAVDSKRRATMSAEVIHEYTDERLRIVPDALWQRVKARHDLRTQAIGERVKRGLTLKSARRTGSAPRYLFSTLLECGQCGANFVMVNASFYGCSSYKHGGPAVCPNNLYIKRTTVEEGLMIGIRRKLLAPEVVAEFERRFAKRAAEQARKPNQRVKRMAELDREVANLADAIANGLLRASPALAARLAAAENELSSLKERGAPTKIARIFPRLREHFENLVADLPNVVKRDPDRARASIRQITGGSLRVESDGKMVRFLARQGQVEAAFLRAAGGTWNPKIEVVAGARFS
jgi:site-specific DNA recombinase